MSGRGGRLERWRRGLRRRWKHRPGFVPWLLSVPPRLALGILRALPPFVSLGLVERVGRLMYWVPSRRRIGRTNLALALPDRDEKERARIGRLSCGLFARNVAETLVLGEHLRPEEIPALAEFEPGARELIVAQRERGAVFVQGHFGSMEGTMGLLGSLGLRLLTVVRLPNNHYVARALTRGREGWGVDLTTRDGAVRRMCTRLAEGGSVMQPMDVNARKGGIFVPWFGRLASTEPAAAWLALQTGRPLIVCWGVRLPGKRRWGVGAELVREAAAPERPTDEQLVGLTARVHASLEAAILRHPEQYFWIHDRYRTRPPDEESSGAAPDPSSRASTAAR